MDWDFLGNEWVFRIVDFLSLLGLAIWLSKGISIISKSESKSETCEFILFFIVFGFDWLVTLIRTVSSFNDPMTDSSISSASNNYDLFLTMKNPLWSPTYLGLLRWLSTPDLISTSISFESSKSSSYYSEWCSSMVYLTWLFEPKYDFLGLSWSSILSTIETLDALSFIYSFPPKGSLNGTYFYLDPLLFAIGFFDLSNNPLFSWD